MAWVRSEYAGEFAVVAAWLSALLPWSVSAASQGGKSLVVVRFPLFRFQFLYGVDLGGLEKPFLTVLQMSNVAPNPTTADAYTAWLVGAAVLAVALLLSVVYYAREKQVEAAPVDPVTVMGGLLLATGLLLSLSVVLLSQGFVGVTIPVGAVIVLALGVVLLRADRTGSPT